MPDEDLTLSEVPSTRVGMGIRRSRAEVFEALADPAITTRFWFTKSTGKVEPGARLTWDWDMYGVSVAVTVKEVEPGSRILFEWSAGVEPRTVEFRFFAWSDASTYVEVTERGYVGTGDEITAAVADSTGGFSFMLSALKALLECGVVLRVVLDAHPSDVTR